MILARDDAAGSQTNYNLREGGQQTLGTGREERPQQLRLFLHIGVHKTGSTSLQLRFSGNSDTLRQHGILYPLGRFPDHPHQHSEIVRLIAPAMLGELAALLRGIYGEAVASACHTIVLSGEDISRLPEESVVLLRDALYSAGFVPVVVVFFRPFIDHVRSLASERMKMRGGFVTPSRLAALLRRFEESEVTRRFAAAFGAENVIRHDLSDGEDSVALFDKDIGLSAGLATSWVNTRIDFATLSWLNAIKAELDVPLAVPQRLYAKHFDRRPSLSAGEAAFLAEVANTVGGKQGELLTTQLQQLRARSGEALPIEAQLDYLKRFNRFAADLQRYVRRRALRRRLSNLFGRRTADVGEEKDGRT